MSSDFQSHNEKLIEIWAGWECEMIKPVACGSMAQ